MFCLQNFLAVFRLALLVAAAAATACSADKAPDPTLNELLQKPEFQQCLADSGIPLRQVSECVADNPDEESARACIQAHLDKKSVSKSDALYRCYHPRPQG